MAEASGGLMGPTGCCDASGSCALSYWLFLTTIGTTMTTTSTAMPTPIRTRIFMSFHHCARKELPSAACYTRQEDCAPSVSARGSRLA